MRRYLDSTLVRVGLGLLAFGSGPLIVVLLAAALGFTSDPRPNPVGLGMLAGCTFWPAVVCVVVGIFQARKQSDHG